MKSVWRALLVVAVAATSLSGSNGHNARIVATNSQGAAAPPAPIEPVTGYSAWFDAAQRVYSDGACSVLQATDGGNVAC